MAQFMKLLVTIALTFAVTTAIITTTTTITNPTTEKFAPKDPFKDLTSPEGVKIRPSRFLAQKDVEGQEPKARNRNAAERCNKDSEICCSTGANSTMACCNSKCMDLSTDKKNCGACNKKCKFGETCCGGQCVNMSYDKRHCGECYHCCQPGGYCVYGLYNYA
ncbi:PREDICTED: stigma-specific STIG1-like protein 2 [Brassica oleracea var. oleracea]|uniref:stigma-specific STIG1-like protein 2 n=1 Tax=Brassica oleracea var. oleracea TaxID=109376 RepID=UPI0006A6FE8F|nr:PREDICTED: stigma-specific STIG1-like protein 2 [Brassica oleracea var. oleracea]